MELWGGLSAEDLGGATPDIIVFPEGVDAVEIERARALCPEAIVAGAVLKGRRMHGVIQHGPINQIDYQKVLSDGQSDGGPLPLEAPFYEANGLAIGLLICMDVDCAPLTIPLVEKLVRSTAPYKMLCVPSQMVGGQRFTEDMAGLPSWTGFQIALINNVARYPPNRLPSFITDAKRLKVVVQKDHEPIGICLTPVRRP